jgi:selenide,water dikinase
MPQGRLAEVLRGLGDEKDERLLVGPETMDDAGVVHVEGIALVQTVDFFPPVVDDPRLYGAIAAANSLSDVYAMGGRPVSALTLASFPPLFPEDWLGEILLGGFDKVREAGAVVAGGHTVEGEVQFGFACTGVVDPDAVAANAGAKAGDVVYLTKALGMGSMTTGAKANKISWDELKPAAEQMATLNSAAAEAMNAVGAHACTDVTGFGLMGHARNVAVASGVTMRLRSSDAPLFPGALELSQRGVLSGGSKRGQKALADEVSVDAGVDEALRNLLFDAETSGGLLIVLAADKADALERELRERSLPVHAIGEVVASTGVAIELV